MKRRLLNAGLAVIGLGVLGPLMLPLALAIVLESRGSPLFLQKRVGRGERVFTCCKLRTMAKDAPNAATHLVKDSHVTRMGRFLRRSRLDEVPQLWNVLVGDMDLVGPRPCLPSQTVLIEARRREGVFAIRPGITGLAQVQGLNMSQPERLAVMDGRYVRHRSFYQDVLIILATVNLYRIGTHASLKDVDPASGSGQE